MLKKNIATPGRIFRFLIALLLIIFAIWQKSWIALAFSLFIFFESFMGWCLLYQLLGKNSCPTESNHKDPKLR